MFRIPANSRYTIILFLLLLPLELFAQTYSLPGGPLPPGCTLVGSDVECPALSMGNNVTVTVSQPTQWRILDNWSFGNQLRVNQNGSFSSLTILVSGDLIPGNGAIINASVGVTGSISALNNTQLTGPMVIGGNLQLGNNSTVVGGIDVSGTLSTGTGVVIQGDVTASSIDLGSGNTITGDLDATTVTVASGSTVDGNINATETVVVSGTVTGYVNAPVVEGPGTVTGPICDVNDNEGGCNSTPSVQFYRIDHLSTYLTCLPTEVTVKACTSADCSSVLSVTGSVLVSAVGVTTVSATANFANQSQTTVVLPITQAGQYELTLSNATPAATGPDPYQCSSTSGCVLSAVNTALAVQVGATQVAGDPFSVQLQSIRTDTQTGACQSVVQNVSQVDLSVECLDPGSCTAGGSRLIAGAATNLSEYPVYAAVPASFNSSGVASVTARYEDTGKIRLHAKLQAPNGFLLQGVSGPVVVRPGTIDVIVSNTQSYDQNILARAGDALSVQLIAKSTTGQITENFGNEVIPERLTLDTTATTVTPDAGVDGTVDIVEAFAKTGPGVFSSSDVRYRDVGTIQLNALNQSGDFLGTGPLAFQSEAIGRFLPWDFEIDIAVVSQSCAASLQSFTYLGEAFSLTLKLNARNRNGVTVQNYPDSGSGATIALLAQDQVSLTNLTDRISTQTLQPQWLEGETNVMNPALTLNRRNDGNEDGPFSEVVLAAAPGTGTVEALYVPMIRSNESGIETGADFKIGDTDCQATATCDAKSLSIPLRFVFGRLTLENSFGPETGLLPVTANAEYWAGADVGFIKHSADSCSALNLDGFNIQSEPQPGTATFTGINSELVSGSSGPENIKIDSSGAAGDVVFEYEAPTWLQWGTENAGNPSATATFGLYGGHDRIISWQEIYNGKTGIQQ
ncbi:hypothetical protein E3V39_14570 [Gammaproteobacteria bacterium LSUCC0112]|nr:hypothetical protein E3V39_14570 [Gammaproteobacteria bacterium LSUCC0112]